jgi:AcrR family transcriptional regulator
LTRDRFATRAAILDSAASIIETSGLPALGVNALADAAKCDKVLIYRYFGGLDGVLAALGAERAVWPAVQLAEDDGESLADAMRTVLLEEWASISGSAFSLQCARAETTAAGPLSSAVREQRADHHARAIAALQAAHHIPQYTDLPALLELLSAALTMLALRSASAHAAGSGSPDAAQGVLDPTTAAGWRRIEKMVATIARALLEAPHE